MAGDVYEAYIAAQKKLKITDHDGVPTPDFLRYSGTVFYERHEFDLVSLETAVDQEPLNQAHLVPFLNFEASFLKSWPPTNVPEAWESETTLPHELLKGGLIVDHREIRLSPYHPKAWLNRARTFASLGYGELAVADAYRGRLLVESFLYPSIKKPASELDPKGLAFKVNSAIRSDLGLDNNAGSDAPVRTTLKNFEERLFIIMDKGLCDSRAFSDEVELLIEARKRFPSNAIFTFLLAKAKLKLHDLIKGHQEAGDSKEHIKQETRKGRVKKVAYPWIMPEEYTRSNKSIKKAKARFQAASDNAEVSSITQDPQGKENLGVFATRGISKGEKIVLDRSIYSTTNHPTGKTCWGCCIGIQGTAIVMSCCEAKFCSESCKQEVINRYHRVLCGQDFSWLLERVRLVDKLDNAMIPLLLVKILATAVQQNAKPLKVTCVGALDAGLGRELASWFTLYDNVIAPTKILQQLNVDIFTDTRFDAWALQILILRLENNRYQDSSGTRAWCLLNPLYTMFNHDCDPPVVWDTTDDFMSGNLGGAIEVRATRKIKKGSEIHTSYIPVELAEKERRGQLVSYIGKMCECTRCVRERKYAEMGIESPAYDLTAMLESIISIGTRPGHSSAV